MKMKCTEMSNMNYLFIAFLNTLSNFYTFSSLQVKENIIKVFSRFMETGRTTISFKEPQHDVSISEVYL